MLHYSRQIAGQGNLRSRIEWSSWRSFWKILMMVHLLWNTWNNRWIIYHWISYADSEFKGPTFRISIFSEKEWKQVTEHKFDWFYALHVWQCRSYLKFNLDLKGYLSFRDDALSNGVSHGLIAQPVGLLIRALLTSTVFKLFNNLRLSTIRDFQAFVTCGRVLCGS